jgi:hypothetical protein
LTPSSGLKPILGNPEKALYLVFNINQYNHQIKGLLFLSLKIGIRFDLKS